MELRSSSQGTRKRSRLRRLLVNEVAGDPVVGGFLLEGRVVVHAADVLPGDRAPVVEPAAGLGIDRLGDAALDLDRRPFVVGIGHGNRRQQRLRVRVQRVGQQLLGRGQLNDLAEVHDGDAVTHVAGYRQVMGDVEIGHVEPVGQLEHEVHDRDADAHIEHRRRLVRHYKRRVDDEGTGDGHPLALAARQLVREPEHERLSRSQTNEIEQLGDLGLAVRHGPDPLHGEWFGNRVIDGAPGVHRLERILEDHLHVGPESPQVVFARDVGDVDHLAVVLKQDLAACDFKQLDEHSAGSGLAAARLADQPETLARIDLEVDVVNGVDEVLGAPEHALLNRIPLLEVPYFDPCLGHTTPPEVMPTGTSS